METGASVPGYSGGLAAWVVVSYLDFLSLGVADRVSDPASMPPSYDLGKKISSRGQRRAID